MIPTNFLHSHIDRDAERRRALGKVYSLLIRLAEEAENHTALPDIVSEEEKIGEPTSMGADQISGEVCVCLDPEFLNSDEQEANNSVPLQNNIPS